MEKEIQVENNQLVPDEPMQLEGVDVQYEEMTLTKYEVDRQTYAGNGAYISAGYLGGHPIDTMYVEFGAKDVPNAEPTTVLLRPDEVASIAWLCSSLLFSREIGLLNGEQKTIAR